MINEVNKLLETVRDNEDEFVRSAMENSTENHFNELKKAKKTLTQSKKRILELDKLFARLYEDNVSGKISDERFFVMSRSYEDEQKQLKQTVSELTDFIETKEQKTADTMQFIDIVRKYMTITELTPEIMHELIEKIVVHAPDKSSGHRTQKIEIFYRFNAAVSSVIADNKKRKAA